MCCAPRGADGHAIARLNGTPLRCDVFGRRPLSRVGRRVRTGKGGACLFEVNSSAPRLRSTRHVLGPRGIWRALRTAGEPPAMRRRGLEEARGRTTTSAPVLLPSVARRAARCPSAVTLRRGLRDADPWCYLRSLSVFDASGAAFARSPLLRDVFRLLGHDFRVPHAVNLSGRPAGSRTPFRPSRGVENDARRDIVDDTPQRPRKPAAMRGAGRCSAPRRPPPSRTRRPASRCPFRGISRSRASTRSTPSRGSCATRASATAAVSPSSSAASSSPRRGRRTRRTSSPRSTSAGSSTRRRASTPSSR